MDKYYKQLNDFTKADKSLWQRLVLENPELHAKLREIREENRFPISSDSIVSWIEENSEPGGKEEQLWEKIRLVMDDLGIPQKWLNQIFYLTVVGEVGYTWLSLGYPKTRYKHDNQGKISHVEIIITSEVDITNPVIQKYILRKLMKYDYPPHPLPGKDDPRKLDWRPVWEWKKKHPYISINELAVMLDYNRVTISRALRQLDLEK